MRAIYEPSGKAREYAPLAVSQIKYGRRFKWVV